MDYKKTEWVSGITVISADKMNNLESGVENNNNRIKELESTTKGFIHTQITPNSVWSVEHGLDRYPASVTILDSSGDRVMGDVVYVNPKIIELHFSCEFAGTVIIN